MGPHPDQTPSAAPSLSPSGAERRQAPRYHVSLEVTLESEHNFFMGFAENLSEGGLFLATHHELPVGTLIDVSFQLPGTSVPIEARGEVRWIRPYHEELHAAPGVGIRFVQLEPAAEEAVRAFLRNREPIFYEE